MFNKIIFLFFVILLIFKTLKINKQWETFVHGWYTPTDISDDYDNMKLYDALGVDKLATQEEIKKAYRKLSKKYHPDKMKDQSQNNRFNEIAEAYEILGDEDKRRVYDEQGFEAAKNMDTNKMNTDPSDHFSMYETFFGGGFKKEEIKKAPNLTIHIDLNLEQLYNGELFSVEFTRDVNCLRMDECIVKRKECSGKGYVTVTQQVAPGFIMQNKKRDDNCIDKQKGWKRNCSYCPNGMQEEQAVNLTLEIEKGMKNNDKIIFEKKGKQEIGYENGDVIFIIQTKKHKTYERINNDLHQFYQISLKDALLGFSKNIEHISGSTININKQSITHHNEILKVHNKGMPIKNTNRYGDLYIKFLIQFPESLTNKQKEVIADIL
ncbi:DnaJ protein, putative [Hepatocystis sp. ex Piliocolobus tephrosceles]|uniref:DnaJ protein ERDJ3B-like n=1 Tax=Piliocolobus tephrosceles TaxID=591936 RepID=A0A8C9GKK8_9PRIM|nr:DnaJ protein, putative [Hepatocystis sp. ex Piliocolobus tephrosceles]